MKAIQKDTAREIRRTLGRFFSIFLICGIGASFFAGIRASSPDMRMAADRYFDEQNMMDIQLLSTVGFEQEDLEKIQKTDGIEGLEAGYTADVLAAVEEKNLVVKLYSLPEGAQKDTENDINRPLLTEGRMPQSADECLADTRLKHKGVQLGDRIVLQSGTEDPLSDTLKYDSVAVVGFANSPLYTGTSRDSSNIGNGMVSGFILVPKQAFALERYTQVVLTIQGAKPLMCYDNAYEDAVASAKSKLEALGEKQADNWQTDVIQKAKDELSDAEKEYREAKKKTNRELDKAQAKIDSGKAELEKNKKTWKKNVNAFLAQVDGSFTKLSQVDGWIAEKQAQYDSALSQFEQGKAYMTPEQIAQTEAQLQTMKAGIEQIKQGKAQLTEAQTQLKNAKKQLESGQKTLDANRKKAEKELDDAWEKILEARQDVADLPELKWYVLDRNTNVGFVEYSFSADRMQAIANVFPAFFFLVAALVCLTTMTRMVDEQRNNMGVCKALGYGKAVIAGKYLIYALTASLLGSVIGVALGMQLFPQVIFDAYNSIYNIPKLYKPLYMDLATISVAMAVGTTILATLWACVSSLSHKPSELMRPKAPKIGKRILLERVKFFWKRLSFSGKVTARNLFRYKKRLCMTVFGIAGCTALLLIGFGIRDSISTVATKQFQEIYQYQDVVTMKSDLTTEQVARCVQTVKQQQGVTDAAALYNKSEKVRKQGGEETCDVYITVPEEPKLLNNWVVLKQKKTQTPLMLEDGSAVITDKMAQVLNLQPGDVMEIETDEGWRAVKVQDVAEHYLYHYAYLSPETYRQVYGEPVVYNQIYLKTDSTDAAFEQNLRAALLEKENITQVTSNTETIRMFQETVDNMMAVVVVLILSAGLLAFVVLYNLTNINISERVREIATLKVLGFTRKEVNLYVFRENLWLSLLGIFIGFFLGDALHLYIMKTVEIEIMRFGRQILPMSYGFSALLTLSFALLVSVVMSHKLKKIDMVESLKSVE